MRECYMTPVLGDITKVLKIFAGMLRQSVTNPPVSREWMKTWLGIWWLASIILSLGYTCNLIAFLTIPVYPTRLETIEQLAASDKRVIMQDYGEFVPGALLVSKDHNLRTLGEKLDLFPEGDTYEPAGVKVRAGTHAFVETTSYLYYQQIVLGLTKTAYVMKEEIYKGHLAWFLPKNTAYTDRLSQMLQRLREGGILQMLFNKHMVAMLGPSRRQTQELLGSLGLNHLQGAFLIWLLGITSAALIFGIEVMAVKCKGNWRRRS